MKKRLMALFICVCMLLTAPVLTGAAVAEEAPQPEQAETPAQAPAAEPAEAAAQSAAYELAEQTVTGTASDGASVSITGLLPVGAAAVIEPVVLGHDEIVAYLGEEQAAQMEQYVAYNISVMIGDAEYVLDETVSVTVTQPALEIAEDTQVTVNHVVEDAAAGTVEVKQLSAQTDAGQVSFETDGFSLYLFTVDFHYDSLTYSIDGGSSILLSELFTALNVNRDAKTAQQVTFSDETLVSVARQEDGDWLLTSLAPFQTGETLTVKFSDTDVLTIAVTDAAHDKANDAYQTKWESVISVQYKFFAALPGVDTTYSVNAYWYYKMRINLYDSDGSFIDYADLIDMPQLHGWIKLGGDYWYEYTGKGNGIGNNYNMVTSVQNYATFEHGSINASKPVENRNYNFKRYTRAIFDNQYAVVKQREAVTFKGSENRTVILYVDNAEVARTTVLFPKQYNASTADLETPSVKEGYTYDTTTYSSSNKTYKVFLKTKTYTAAAVKGTGISATTGSGTYKYKASVTFTAAVQPGYTFDGWYNGSTKVSGSTSYSFNMPNSNVTYTAKATANTYTLTTSAEHATILGGYSYTYDASAKIDVTFSPDANYRISAISVDGIALSGDALASAIAAGKVQLDRTMSHSVSVTAVPDTASYTVNYYKADPAGGDAISLGSTAQTGVIGSTITVAAGTGEGQLDWHKPAAGYKSGVLQDSSTTVAADGGSAVSVLYEIDPGQTKELSYTVKYVVSGVEKDPYSVTKSVQLLQPDTLSVENIALKAYPGFKYSDNSASLVQSGSSLTGAGTIANGGVISVNYAPTVSSVTLTMHVLGQYADLTRDFTGSLSVGSYVLDGADSAAATPYSLRHGATVTVSDIRSAHTLSVTDLESASGYTLTKVTYTLPGGSATELTVTGSATDAVEIPEGATNVDLYYERALVPDSGVVDGHLGAVYALLGSAAVLCAAYVFLSGRRRREEG